MPDLIIPWSEVREGDQVLHAGQLHAVAEVWQSFPGGLSVVMPDASKIDVAVPELLTAVRRKQP